MVQVEVRDVLVRVTRDDGGEATLASEHRIVLLGERGGDRVLPIWVGPPEGDAIVLYLAGERLPRPLTIDLTARLLEAAGARVDRVTVNRLEENTFYATVRMRSARAVHEIDARPSDALNLALRAGAELFVDDGVFAGSAFTAGDTEAIDRELARPRERSREGELAGEWTSHSPDLVKAAWPAFRSQR